MTKSSLVGILVLTMLAGCGAPSAPLAASARAEKGIGVRQAGPDAALAAAGHKLLGAYFDQHLDPAGLGKVPIAFAVKSHLLTADQAAALDRDHDNALTRTEYLALATAPALQANLGTMTHNLFAHAAGYDDHLTPTQAAAIEVSFGAKYEPDEPLKPVTFTFGLSDAAFRGADRDRDGRLSRDEAFVPLAEGMVAAIVANGPALAAGVRNLTAFVLPWAH